jgi:hypothetical protein
LEGAIEFNYRNRGEEMMRKEREKQRADVERQKERAPPPPPPIHQSLRGSDFPPPEPVHFRPKRMKKREILRLREIEFRAMMDEAREKQDLKKKKKKD